MTVDELVRNRHSVRKYLDKPVPEDLRDQLDALVESINNDTGLHIQVLYDEPTCFDCRKARYGKFENVRNYISLVGPKKMKDLEEVCGYNGQKIVLKAQELGLNTCWVAMTRGKSQAEIGYQEREVILIALGYGVDQGSSRRMRKPKDISNISEDSPGWFCKGVEYAMLAPTAMNQQRFYLAQQEYRVYTRIPAIGPFVKLDLGIVKYNFELGAGDVEFEWVEGSPKREKLKLINRS